MWLQNSVMASAISVELNPVTPTQPSVEAHVKSLEEKLEIITEELERVKA